MNKIFAMFLILAATGCASGVDTSQEDLCRVGYPYMDKVEADQESDNSGPFEAYVAGGVCCDDFEARVSTGSSAGEQYPHKAIRIIVKDESGQVTFRGTLFGSGFIPDNLSVPGTPMLGDPSPGTVTLGLDLDGPRGGYGLPLTGIGRLEEALGGANLDKLPCGWSVLFYGLGLTENIGGAITPLTSPKTFLLNSSGGRMRWDCSETLCADAEVPVSGGGDTTIQDDVAGIVSQSEYLEMDLVTYLCYELLDQNCDYVKFFDVFSRGFIRGDVNEDNTVNVADAVTLLDGVFGHTVVDSTCYEAQDVNDDGVIDVSDPIYILGVFWGSDAPFIGFGAIEEDLDGDNLTCNGGTGE